MGQKKVLRGQALVQSNYRLPSEKVANTRAENTIFSNSQSVCWGGKMKKVREERLLRIAVSEGVLPFHPLGRAFGNYVKAQ